MLSIYPYENNPFFSYLGGQRKIVKIYLGTLLKVQPKLIQYQRSYGCTNNLELVKLE